MVWPYNSPSSTFNLQSALSSATSDSSLYAGIVGPHHPINCLGDVLEIEDMTMRCEHSTAGPDVLRNQALIDASIALLLIEIAMTTL